MFLCLTLNRVKSAQSGSKHNFYLERAYVNIGVHTKWVNCLIAFILLMSDTNWANLNHRVLFPVWLHWTHHYRWNQQLTMMACSATHYSFHPYWIHLYCYFPTVQNRLSSISCSIWAVQWNHCHSKSALYPCVWDVNASTCLVCVSLPFRNTGTCIWCSREQFGDALARISVWMNDGGWWINWSRSIGLNIGNYLAELLGTKFAFV